MLVNSCIRKLESTEMTISRKPCILTPYFSSFFPHSLFLPPTLPSSPSSSPISLTFPYLSLSLSLPHPFHPFPSLPHRRLISFTTNTSAEPAWHGYMYAALLMLTTVLVSLVRQAFFHAASKIVLKLRASLMLAVYRKVRAEGRGEGRVW